MSEEFLELVAQAQSGVPAFAQVTREACVEAARTYVREQWQIIRESHQKGESGSNVLRRLTEAADTVLRGVAEFGLYHSGVREKLMSQVAICALGGYGRAELSPRSDLDVCLLYDRRLNRSIEAINQFLVPFLWDMGFQAGYTVHRVSEAIKLSRQDPEVYTSYAQARLILGDSRTFARLKLLLNDLKGHERQNILAHVRLREQPDGLPEIHQDLYNLEPDLKENVGGLRDFHAAQWMILITHGFMSLDDLQRLGHIPYDEYLGLVEALDFLWRIRNELHFHTGKAENQLSFSMQQHLANVFGYGGDAEESMNQFMQDYYSAAKRIRHFLHLAARLCDQELQSDPDDGPGLSRSHLTVYRGQLSAGTLDQNWFAENPARLMQVLWESTRRKVPLSYAMQYWMTENLPLVSDAFRSSDVVRRYFVAICCRMLQAGGVLRQAANIGLLGAYLPEFEAVRGIIRYEDFHSYPVDEHTLRALEALAAIPAMEGSVAGVLRKALEHIREPHILIMAILFHDLGKASGETHVDEGVRAARAICERIGMPPDDTNRIAFLVLHHLLMTNTAFYRDTDNAETVNKFAEQMNSDERLRELLLLTYADLASVGPNVWNDWKGALLIKLFLKAERILLGRSQVMEEEFWRLPKAQAVQGFVRDAIADKVGDYLKGMGERYFIAFSPEYMARHLECLEEARETGLALRCWTHEDTGMSEVAVCTRDRLGLFSEIAGSFASQLVNVEGAALFTLPDGWVVDCFMVKDAANDRPMTHAQFQGLKRVLGEVILHGDDIQAYVEQSRRRLFALLQPRVPVRTRVGFDNTASTTETVVDIETGDRTGLLYDIARSLSIMGVDIRSARIMTDARRVRDAFYIQKNDGRIEDPAVLASLRTGVEQAIHGVSALENKGDLG
ncbi:MAG TPA: [protein-PII] uridylyltransferase [Candidatus Hydrogenedentes bacterium]|nr:[protein-PII] uridylyltransferase [Candidatus Hydrogenedentota bacterium]